MEGIESTSDSESDTDGYSKEVEEELYSVLHHNDFSQGIPAELLDKYSISTDSKNELVISLKPRTNSKSKAHWKKGVVATEPNLSSDTAVNSTHCSELSSASSREDEVVVVDTDDTTPVVKPSFSKNRGVEKVFIEEDSEGDSSVEILETPRKRKYSGASENSSVISLSSGGDENLEVIINTTGGDGFDSDGNVSDVVDNKGFKWTAVESPSSWTKEMRKYYNNPCDRLRYFDHKKIRQGIRSGGSEDWFISHRDRYPERRWAPKCDICRQTDHFARNCPKQDPTCHMCGLQGHTNEECPNSICLQCGSKNNQYTTTCRYCSHMSLRPCFTCNTKGHESKTCPEEWRKFHSMVEEPVPKPTDSGSGPFLCCNCGATSHAYEQCSQTYLSNITVSLPAYDWLHGKRCFGDWRYSGSSPGNSRSPPKRRKTSHRGAPFRDSRSRDRDFDRDDFSRRPPSRFQQPPVLPWYLNHARRPEKSKSVKRKDRRKKNYRNKSPGINFR